jgi:hypothetical protein
MIAADTPRLAVAAPTDLIDSARSADTSVFGRLGALITRVAFAAAAPDGDADQGVWTSVARGI